MANRGLMVTILCAFFLTAAFQTAFAVKDEVPLSTLEEEVLALLKGDEIVRRRNIDKVFELADLYRQKGNTLRAIELYEAGLTVNAANLKRQMELALLLMKYKRKDDAVAKAKLVYELAEEELLINDSLNLLQNSGIIIKENEYIPDLNNPVKIMIIPLGTPNMRVVESFCQQMQEIMGIGIILSEKTRGIGQHDRTFTPVFLNDYFSGLKENMGKTNFEAAVAELGFKDKDLDLPENRKDFIYRIFEGQTNDAKEMKAALDKKFEETDNHLQYNTMRFLSELHDEYRGNKRADIKGYLAITNEDLYEGKSRFRFGGALPGRGVMSYHRFTGAFNQEPQNRKRLVTRTLKQGLSSANFVLGILRCSNPYCARAYPHSILELDQKQAELCSECQDNLNKYIRANKK